MKTFNNTSIMRGAWAITREGLTALSESMKSIEAIDIRFEDFFNIRQPMTIDSDGTAIISVKGSMIDNAPGIFEKIGNTDYRTIISEIGQAKNAGATGIVFCIDSPGGSVAGLAEAADAIASCGLPTMAYCDGMACSAAYYLASSTHAVVSSKSATVGNIGTVLSWYDDSKLLESMGISVETITNDGADLKGTFRDTPMSDQQREFLQAEVDQMGADFRDHVAANRDVDEEVFRAGWYHGMSAMTLGLIDGIATFDEAVAWFKQS